MSKFLIVLGATLLAAGLAWPWLQKAGLGRLPGDFVVEGESFKFYFPLVTGLLISVVVSLILWLIYR